MNHALLEADHQDALREIVNIAMGRAGAVLSEVFDSFVTLSVPQIAAGPASKVMDDILPSGDENWLAIRQAFRDQLEGEAVVIFDGHNAPNLAGLVGLGHEDSNNEVMLDVGNMLVGACVNGIGEILGARITFSPPSIWSGDPKSSDDIVLVIGTTFHIAERALKNNVVIALPRHALPQLIQAIGRFIELL